VGCRVARPLDEIAGRVSDLTDHRQLRDVADYSLGGILSGRSDRLLEDVAASGVDQPLHRLAGDGDSAEQQSIDETAHSADRVLESAAQLLDDLRMIVDEGQSLIDDVDD